MPDIALETIGITKSFRKRCVVDDLNLTVYEGDIYGFLGPNGAGKSTTIRMLTGLVTPHRGTARLMGIDVRKYGHKSLKDVGALVETPSFYRFMSARENLSILSRLSGGCSSDRIDQTLEIVGLLDRANDKVKNYSQGMRQRLGIAQALLPNPRLVILDEPTNGLDPQGMKDVRELIIHLARDQKITVFLSSHLLHEVEQICTRVGIINRGKLVAEGSVKELLNTKSGVITFQVSDVKLASEIIRQYKGAELISTELETVTIRGDDNAAALVNRLLVMGNVDVRSIIPRNGSLEELFLDLIEGGEDAC
ncbi:MAG: ABC transporter ATP-binding protein [Armatimonadota bacterium]